jgi:hypothetical protein
MLFSDLEMPRGSRMSFNAAIKRYPKKQGLVCPEDCQAPQRG